jgi:hypothetical protein
MKKIVMSIMGSCLLGSFVWAANKENVPQVHTHNAAVCAYTEKFLQGLMPQKSKLEVFLTQLQEQLKGLKEQIQQADNAYATTNQLGVVARIEQTMQRITKDIMVLDVQIGQLLGKNLPNVKK